MEKRPPIYGIMAEFHSPEALVAAAQRAHGAGYRRMDGYTPFPVEGLAEAVGFHKTRLPLLVLIGGLTGLIGGLGMQVYLSSVAYPLNVGGRPLVSIPYFIPVTFELTILLAALTAVFGMLALNGLPMPYHPVFNDPRFEMASRHRFFLCIEARDPQFDLEKTSRFLQQMSPDDVVAIEH
ncbi:MAG TPA: DUF3341 domain-containing protein [Candidatus Kapabacteria bacterium]|jgi:hypothetical protein|nr:DUF3341 domain-containing protein [Candidatus Kapabacteria bacterium]